MQKRSLNGQWNCLPDLENIGIKNQWFRHETLKSMGKNLIPTKIPSSFNLIEEFHLFEGVFWHYLEFNLDSEIDFINYDFQLKFNGVNYSTKVWLNGIFIGEHDGGFTPFKFVVNDSIKKDNNFLAVRVDNIRRKNGIPALFFDWFNWGGIYRDVNLLILNKSRVKEVKISTEILTLEKAEIDIRYKTIGNLNLKWQIIDISDDLIIQNGQISLNSTEEKITVFVNNPKLWSPDTPFLYQIQMFEISSENSTELLYQCDFGMRQIEVKFGHLFLNKKRIKLKGISLHEEYMPYGRTIPYEKRKEDLERIKALGFNSVRTAHYSHDESLIKIADKIGILILEEIPVYWDCNYKSRKTFKLAAKMLRDLIKRDYNHPSVIWWSVGNEIPTHRRNCSRFIKRLMDFARMHDSTRIVTFVSRKLNSDILRRNADVAALNTYFGWYFGSMKMLSLILDWIHPPISNKPWIFTEFGAGAKYGFRDKSENPPKYSEEYQLKLLDYTIRTINSKEYFSGWFIWIFRDFKSNHRSNEYQQGYNRKGIVSEKSTQRKLIYNHIPNILNKKRKAINTKLLGLVLWILFFPFMYLILTHIVTLVITIFVDKITYKRGIQRLDVIKQNF